MKVFILRGLPGSGKSSWATRQIIERKTSVAVVSADTYHYVQQPPREDGTLVTPVYQFKQENAGAAHNRCLLDFLQAIKEGWQIVIVDNTNLSAWEIAPYYRLAESFACDVEIVHHVCSVATSIARNTHSVPVATIEKMAARVDVLPLWWKQSVIDTEPK